MTTNIDEAMHDLIRLTAHAKDAGDYPEFFDGLHDRIRSTLTAQQQRIEALEAQRDEAVDMLCFLVARVEGTGFPCKPLFSGREALRRCKEFLARIESDEASED